MEINIDDKLIIDMIRRHIESRSGISLGTLGDAVLDEIKKKEPELRKLAAKAVSNILNSSDFMQYVEKIIKDHMTAEAARIGRNCARAIAMDKPRHET